MKNKIALLVAPRRFEIAEEDLPSLGDHDLLVRIVSSGLCHSDIPSWLGESAQTMDEQGWGKMIAPPIYPLRFGHEAQGIVEDMGSKVTNFMAGDFVTGSIKPGYASYAVCPEDKLLLIPRGPKNPFDCICEASRTV